MVEASFPLFVLALVFFPDGRLPSPRWRWGVWTLVAAGLLDMTFVAFSDVNFSANFPHLADPVKLIGAATLMGTYNFPTTDVLCKR